MSGSLRPHGLQHTRLPCPSPAPGACSNSISVSQWCHPTISSSVIPFFSCLQSFPASGSFPNSQFFESGGQSIGVAASSISPSSEYSGLISFRVDWLDLLAVQGTLKSFLQHHSSKASILQCSAFFIVQLSNPYMTTGKIIALTRQTFVGKVMSLLFNMPSRKMVQWTYLQDRNRDTDVENGHVDTTERREEWGELGGWNWHIYTTMCQGASGKLLCNTGSSAWCSVVT